MPYIPVVTNLVGIGNLSVDIFFFLSGLCLSLAAERHHYIENHWKGYYRRRLERVLIPYLIVGVPYYLWNCLCEASGSPVKRGVLFLANLSSASFWLRGTQTTWYVYAIILFYFLFPLLLSFIKKRSRTEQLALLAGLACFSFLSAYTPILKNSVIVWARLPIFAAGIMAGEAGGQTGRSSLTKLQTVAALAFAFLLGAIASFSELSETFTIPTVFRFLLYFPLTLLVMTLLSANPPRTRARALEWLGGLSLELYLVHITLLHPLKYYGIMDAVGYWLYLLLPAVSAAAAWLVKKIEEMILKRA